MTQAEWRAVATTLPRVSRQLAADPSAFKGDDRDQDPTALLAPDGDHPNAAGHQAIADALYAALPSG